MLTVKTMMTEILLEVTDELIQKSVKSFVSQMKNSRGIHYLVAMSYDFFIGII